MKNKTIYMMEVILSVTVWMLMVTIATALVISSAQSPWSNSIVAIVGLASVAIILTATAEVAEVIKAGRRDYRYRQYQERRK